jgi:DNA polymerase III delta subunit
MLHLIYGTNQLAIRDYVLRAAKTVKATSIKEYNLADATVGDVEATLQADIFGGAALNVLDVTKSAKAQLTVLCELLQRYPTADVVLVSTKDLEATSSVVKLVRAAKGRVVSATVSRPKEIFNYLDALYSKRSQVCYKSLQKVLTADNDPVYILVMLQYQLRNIALAKFGLTNKLAPFQVAAAHAQAANYTDQQIVALYGLLVQYDVALKTGRIVPETVVPLVTQKILMR